MRSSGQEERLTRPGNINGLKKRIAVFVLQTQSPRTVHSARGHGDNAIECRMRRGRPLALKKCDQLRLTASVGSSVAFDFYEKKHKYIIRTWSAFLAPKKAQTTEYQLDACQTRSIRRTLWRQKLAALEQLFDRVQRWISTRSRIDNMLQENVLKAS